MIILQIAIDSFAAKTEYYYPATLNTTIKKVLQDLGEKSDNDISIAGANDYDTIFTGQIGCSGLALLPSSFKNPYDDSKPVLITSKVDPPIWSKNYAGVVYYVPLEVKGNIAKRYKIYGAGENGLASLVLSSEGVLKF